MEQSTTGLDGFSDRDARSVDEADRYEILRVVNRGGMGEIALGRVKGTKGFEKLVVLKRLRADAEREDHRHMFDVEAELMSRIEHPNIVQVFDQPTVSGVQYLAMAYVQGRNLDQLIRKARQEAERVTPAFALTVACEMLRGLAFVHRLKDSSGNALGVVHQDITPSNVMVSFFGEVKITDFGIAYVTSRDGGRRKGVLKGKPRYVAPEVLAGKRVNNRADIYGTAVVLYELLTGQPLFARATIDDTLGAVARNELPDFPMLLPMVSPGVHAIMTRALAKDPNDRYRSAEEMHKELARELNSLGGALSSSQLGYLLRKWFNGSPDVPEVDPTLDEAIAGSSSGLPQAVPDLQETLNELDRLLGTETGSADIFDLPPEIQQELAEIEDGDPFDARTPIPELALSGPNGEDLLMRAMLKEPMGLDDGMNLPSFPSSEPAPEPPRIPSSAGFGQLDEPDSLDPVVAARSARRNLGATGEYTFTPIRRRRSDTSSDLDHSASEPGVSAFVEQSPVSTSTPARNLEPIRIASPPPSSRTVEEDLGAVRAPGRAGFMPGMMAGLLLGLALGMLIGWKLLAGS